MSGLYLLSACVVSMYIYVFNVLQVCNISGMEAFLQTALLRWCGYVIRVDDTCIPRLTFFGQFHCGSRHPGDRYKWYKYFLKVTSGDVIHVQVCSTRLRSTTTRELEAKCICENLVHQLPATVGARSATGCVICILDSLPTTSPTCVDETCRIDGSVHPSIISCIQDQL